MEKFVPYEKLSKKEKRKIDQMRRGSWGDVNPVSRKVESKKLYNRKRSQDWKNDVPPLPRPYFLPISQPSSIT